MAGHIKRGEAWGGLAWCLVLALAGGSLAAAKQKPSRSQDRLSEYVQRARAAVQPAPTEGGLWSPGGRFTDLAGDYKARNLNDLIVIKIVEQTTAVADGTVKSQRKLDASSSISAFWGQLGARNGWQNIFTPHSQQSLDGQAQTSSTSQLTTRLAGQVVEVLPNGAMVVEATREVEMNNQHQTLIVRGIVRPGDIAADNSVFSTSLGSLEVELKGKGVVSDGVRPPNPIMRAILRIVGF
jgi:flagellar L-ring protein precursor FlgH